MRNLDVQDPVTRLGSLAARLKFCMLWTARSLCVKNVYFSLLCHLQFYDAWLLKPANLKAEALSLLLRHWARSWATGVGSLQVSKVKKNISLLNVK